MTKLKIMIAALVLFCVSNVGAVDLTKIVRPGDQGKEKNKDHCPVDQLIEKEDYEVPPNG